MGKGEKMVQDFNGNTIVIVDALNNMNELDIDNEVFRIYSDGSKNESVKHWMDSDMISKFPKCEKCSTLHGLNIDEIEKRKDITFDKEGIPENGHTTIEDDESLSKESGETFNKHSDSSDIRSDEITDNCLDCKSSELYGFDEKTKHERTYSDSLVKNNEISINAETAKERVQAEYFRFGVEAEAEHKTDIKDSCSGERGDLCGHSNGIIELDINNPNLFSDFEDSDDDVFETDIKRNTSLPPYLKFVSRRSYRPSKTHSESAILPDLSQKKEKPAQTVSDSAIVTALSKRNHKSVDLAARRKSVHFAIFPYVIEIPRVSDLEEEFLEAEREKYGKVP